MNVLWNICSLHDIWFGEIFLYSIIDEDMITLVILWRPFQILHSKNPSRVRNSDSPRYHYRYSRSVDSKERKSLSAKTRLHQKSTVGCRTGTICNIEVDLKFYIRKNLISYDLKLIFGIGDERQCALI